MRVALIARIARVTRGLASLALGAAVLGAACGDHAAPVAGPLAPAPPVASTDVALPPVAEAPPAPPRTAAASTPSAATTPSAAPATSTGLAPVAPGWWVPATRPGAFPGVAFVSVRAYEMEPMGADGRPVCLRVLEADGRPCSQVRTPGNKLSDRQVKQLMGLVQARSSWGGGSKCFVPRHGFVFLDAAGAPVAEIALCFECEMIQGRPTLLAGEKYSHGVSEKGLAGLRALCRDLGMSRCE